MSTRKDTRSALLDACARLLEQAKGAPLRLEDVASAAGVSRQALYLHFASKSELLVALVEHSKAEHGFEESMAAVRRASTADEALTLWLSLHVEFTPRIMRVARAIEVERCSDPTLESAWQARRESRYLHARRLVERAADEGRLAEGMDVNGATDLLWALTAPAITEDLLVRRRWSKDRLFSYLDAVLKKTILRFGESPTKEKRDERRGKDRRKRHHPEARGRLERA